MVEWLRSLVPWGLEAILWVQGFRTPWLDAFFQAVTNLGTVYFYIVFIGGLYWAVNRAWGLSLGYVLVSCFLYTNDLLKEVVGIPRPTPEQVAVLAHETSPSFPSGHTQGSTAVWGYMAYRLSRPWAWVVAVVAIFLVGLSRIYLGVHYPQDVVGGFLLGAVSLVLFILAERWLERRGRPLPPWAFWGLTVGLPAALFLLRPGGEAARALGLLAGFGVGHWMEARFVRFADARSWAHRLARFALGLVLTLALYFGLAAITPPLPLLRALRYALLGWAAMFLVPWLLVRLGLAETRSPA
ncbi:MAG: phosphatase PAP2 family protein [Anaerolineae bacterium]|nr:phosphatase PAP2 family protein [Anaerolineae bacterium]